MSQIDDDNDDGKIKIVFAEGCFDGFDGTQEELDELIAQIQEMADSGELFERAVPVGTLEDIEEEVLEDILPMLTNKNTRH